MLRNLRQFTDIPAVLQERVFRKVFQIAEVSNPNKEEMNAYETDLKYSRDWKNAMDFAVKEASEKAAAKAAAEAATKAAAVAKAEKINIARTLKNVGVSIDIITQSTGLTSNEVEALQGRCILP